MGTVKLKINGEWVKIPTVQGKRGEKGEKGDAPQKGIDYWTDADKQDIKKYCDEQIGIIETLLKEV